MCPALRSPPEKPLMSLGGNLYTNTVPMSLPSSTRYADKKEPLKPISWRGALVGLALIPLNTYWISVSEMVDITLKFTTAALPLNVIFILACILLYNGIARRIHPRLTFSEGDLLIIYIMLASSSALSGYDSLVSLMGTLLHATWNATPENDWAALFGKYLPTSLIITDPNAVRNFYLGEADFFRGGYWEHWRVPALNWMVFLGLLMFLLLCITVLLRRPWTEQEKLTYPIIQLPLEMSRPAARLFQNRLMWMGFAVAASVEIINGLHHLYPSVPRIRLSAGELQTFFTTKPWSAMGWTPVRYHLFMIGMTYLLPLDLSVSCWVFFWIHQAERIFGSAVGLTIPGYPFAGQQAMGALIGIVGGSLFAIRRYLKAVAQKILFNRGIDDSREPLGYRGVLVGIVLSSVLLGLFCLQMGLSLWVIVTFFALFLILCVGMVRIRAEIGVPEHGFPTVVPQDSLIMLLGTRTLGPRNLSGLSLFVWFSTRKRSYVMPHQIEAFKIAERAHLSYRGVFWLLLLAIIVCLICTFIIFPTMLYHEGAEASAGGMRGMGWFTFDRLSSWLKVPRSADWIGNGFLLGGLLTTLGLTFLRHLFIWWPLHPAGYLLALSGSITEYWFTIFIASIIKWIVFRHGGARSYRKSVPFFLGLILGDYVVGCSWALLGVILDRPLFAIWG